MVTQMNASGSATDELNRKLNSLEGRMNGMINAFNKFWSSTVNSELIKVTISLITELIQAFTTLNIVTGGLLAPTALFLGLLSKFGKLDLPKILYDMAFNMGILTTGTYGASGAFEIVTMSATKFNIVLGAIGIAIVAGGLILNRYREDVRKTKEELDNFRQAQSDLVDILSKGDSMATKTAIELQDLSKKYEETTLREKELRAEILKKGGKQGSSEYNELMAQIKEIEDRFKKLGTTATDVKSKIDVYNKSLEETKKQNNATTESFEHLNGRM
jgi:hypothetical protein